MWYDFVNNKKISNSPTIHVMANGVHLMTEKRKTWIVSAAISFGFYLVCVFLGAFVNVCISMTAGYSSFADYKASGYDPGILLVLIFTLINHIFFSRLTVRLASRYAIKQLQWHL